MQMNRSQYDQQGQGQEQQIFPHRLIASEKPDLVDIIGDQRGTFNTQCGSSRISATSNGNRTLSSVQYLGESRPVWVIDVRPDDAEAAQLAFLIQQNEQQAQQLRRQLEQQQAQQQQQQQQQQAPSFQR